MRPRHLALDLHTVRKLVEHDALQVLIVLHDQRDIMKVVLDLHAPPLILKLLFPSVRIILVKFLRCRLLLFLENAHLHILVSNGKISHRIEGLLRIIVRELVDPHDIKSIQKLAAGRIRRMKAVRKLIVDNDDAGGTVSRDIVISSFHRRRLIYIRQELLYRFPDRICTAESADYACLCQRIRLLLCGLLHRLGFP